MKVIVPVALLVPPERVASSVRLAFPPLSLYGPPASVVSEVPSGLTSGFSPVAPQRLLELLLLPSPLT